MLLKVLRAAARRDGARRSRAELDMQTLEWTRGAIFRSPVSKAASGVLGAAREGSLYCISRRRMLLSRTDDYEIEGTPRVP
jgi:hypothetical protein